MLAAAGSALLFAGNAEAHARLKESTPAKGEVLAASPSQVSITFTQEVQKVSGTYGIDVRYAPSRPQTGIMQDAEAGPAVVKDDDRTMVSVPLRPDLAQGRYEVHWKNVSDADGDPAEGAFSFYIGVQPTAEDLAADGELALIGEEDQTPQPTDGASTPASGDTPAASATATNASSDDDDGSGNDAPIIIGVIVVVGIVAGFLAARFVTRRRT